RRRPANSLGVRQIAPRYNASTRACACSGLSVEPTPSDRELSFDCGEQPRKTRHPPGLSRFTTGLEIPAGWSQTGESQDSPVLLLRQPRIASLGRMVEVVGDASRDGCWALARLTVEGDRIVSAKGEGLERPLEGL